MTFAVPTLADLQDWQQRLDELHQVHGGIVAGHQGWALVGLHGPDGIEVRLYTLPDLPRGRSAMSFDPHGYVALRT